jgi:hypothetical protein
VSGRQPGRTRPACHRDHRGRRAHSVAALRVHHPGHHDPEHHLRDDRQAVLRDHGYQAPLASCLADQSSAWASSPGWAGAFQAAQGVHRGQANRGRQADAVLQDERRPDQDAADAIDPSLVMKQMGCCRGAVYQDAG